MGEMKLIMENWRSYCEEQNNNIILTEIRAEDWVQQLKNAIVWAAIRKGGGTFAKEFVREIGPEAAEAAVLWAAAIPAIGSFIAAPLAALKTGKVAMKGLLTGAEVAKATWDIAKMAADDYVGIDDDKIGKNPLAKLFNIDDPMEVPIAEDFLNNFAGLMLKYLKDNPDQDIDPDTFAELTLANYINNKGYMKNVEPPRGGVAGGANLEEESKRTLK